MTTHKPIKLTGMDQFKFLGQRNDEDAGFAAAAAAAAAPS
jgi:hypothetical protein